MDGKKWNESGAELNDEQLNEAAGGGGPSRYVCGVCGNLRWGAVPFFEGGKPCCADCYAEKHKNDNEPRMR